MEMFISLLVQIISGVIGGNVAGMTKQSLGTGLNTMLGGIGGLVLGQVAAALTGTSGGEALDVAMQRSHRALATFQYANRGGNRCAR